MRLLPIATAAVSLALIGAGGTATARAMSRASSFQHSAAALERTWTQDVDEGVPAASVTPVRRSLDTSQYLHASGWSPMWWFDDGSAFLGTLRHETAQAWTAAMNAARAKAEGAMTAWSQMELQYGRYVDTSAASGAARWSAQLAAATTPLQIDTLVSVWMGDVDVARRGAMLDEVTVAAAPYGGLPLLLANANHAVAVARGDNLVTGQVPTLVDTLSATGSEPTTTTQAIAKLAAALSQLNALIKLDGNVAGQLRGLDGRVTLATAHNAPGATGFASQAASLATSLHAGGTTSNLESVSGQIATVERSVNAALTSVGCGHNVPNGKVIDVDLTTQSAVFYDDGCVAGSSLVTTGMPGLRTPTGTYHIYAKYSPITFISPWPKSSKYYYSPESAQYGMEFRGGGFFLHDAPWEPSTGFGPGSENGPDASHGCVHFPTPTMAWLYSWSPIGTTVVISY
ncbi:MAG TPA: L,D-transpeptidase [Candidatus Dormibacteraeota bacterium]